MSSTPVVKKSNALTKPGFGFPQSMKLSTKRAAPGAAKPTKAALSAKAKEQEAKRGKKDADDEQEEEAESSSSSEEGSEDSSSSDSEDSSSSSEDEEDEGKKSKADDDEEDDNAFLSTQTPSTPSPSTQPPATQSPSAKAKARETPSPDPAATTAKKDMPPPATRTPAAKKPSPLASKKSQQSQTQPPKETSAPVVSVPPPVEDGSLDHAFNAMVENTKAVKDERERTHQARKRLSVATPGSARNATPRGRGGRTEQQQQSGLRKFPRVENLFPHLINCDPRVLMMNIVKRPLHKEGDECPAIYYKLEAKGETEGRKVYDWTDSHSPLVESNERDEEGNLVNYSLALSPALGTPFREATGHSLHEVQLKKDSASLCEWFDRHVLANMICSTGEDIFLRILSFLHAEDKRQEEETGIPVFEGNVLNVALTCSQFYGVWKTFKSRKLLLLGFADFGEKIATYEENRAREMASEDDDGLVVIQSDQYAGADLVPSDKGLVVIQPDQYVGADLVPSLPSLSRPAFNAFTDYTNKSAMLAAIKNEAEKTANPGLKESTWATVARPFRDDVRKYLMAWRGVYLRRPLLSEDEASRRQQAESAANSKKVIKGLEDESPWAKLLSDTLRVACRTARKKAEDAYKASPTHETRRNRRKAIQDSDFAFLVIVKSLERVFSPFNIGLFELGNRCPHALFYRKTEDPAKPGTFFVERWTHWGKRYEPVGITEDYNEWKNGDMSTVLWRKDSPVPCFGSMLPPFADLSKHHPKVVANAARLQYTPHSWSDTPIYPVSSVITAADARGQPTEGSRKYFSIVLDPTLGRTPLAVHHDFPARQTQVATQMLVSVVHLPPATKTVKNKKTVVASPLSQVDEDVGITASEHLYGVLASLLSAIGVDWCVEFASKTDKKMAGEDDLSGVEGSVDVINRKKPTTTTKKKAPVRRCRPSFVGLVLQDALFVERSEPANDKKPDLFPLQVPLKLQPQDEKLNPPALRGVIAVEPRKNPHLKAEDFITSAGQLQVTSGDRVPHQVCLLDGNAFLDPNIACSNFLTRKISDDAKGFMCYYGGFTINRGITPEASPGAVYANVSRSLADALVEQYVTASKAVEAVLREYNEQVTRDGGETQAAASAAVPQAMRTLFNQIEAFLKTAPGEPVNLKELLDARIKVEKKKATANKHKTSLPRSSSSSSKKGKEKATDENDFYDDSDLEDDEEMEEELIEILEDELDEDGNVPEKTQQQRKKRQRDDFEDSDEAECTSSSKKRGKKDTSSSTATTGAPSRKRKSTGSDGAKSKGMLKRRRPNFPAKSWNKQKIYDYCKKKGADMDKIGGISANKELMLEFYEDYVKERMAQAADLLEASQE